MGKKTVTALVEWLEEKAAAVRRIETRAQAALHEENDSQTYRQLMEEKATLLATLTEDCSHLIAKIPAKHRDDIRKGVSRFSASATSALKIGSVFYMSALLYPEEYNQEDPNDLEVFINELKEGNA